MEPYFKAVNIKEESAKVHIASLYPIDDAMLWCRHWRIEIQKGLSTIDTWESLMKEIDVGALKSRRVFASLTHGKPS